MDNNGPSIAPSTEIKTKKSSKVIPWIVAAIFACAAIGEGVFIGINSSQNNTTNSQETEETSETSSTDDDSAATKDIALHDISQNSDLEYDLVAYSTESALTVSSTIGGKTVEIRANTGRVEVPPSFTLSDFEETLNLDKKIRSIYNGGFGQEDSHETIFFLYEDGTLGFISKWECLKNGTCTVHEVKDVSDVVTLVNAGRQIKGAPTGGGITTLAVHADGSFYDLTDVVSEALSDLTIW